MDKKYDVRIEIIEGIINSKKEIKRLEEMLGKTVSEQERGLINTSINTQKEKLEKLKTKRADICNELLEKKKKYEEKNQDISKALNQLTKKKEILIKTVEETKKDNTKSNKDLELQEIEEKIGKLEDRLNKNRKFINEIDKTLKLMQYEHKATKDEKKDEYEFNEVANVNGKVVKIAKMSNEQQDMEKLTRYNLKIEEEGIDTYKDIYISKKIDLDKIDKDKKYKSTVEEFFNPDRIAQIEKDAEKYKSNRLYMGHINRLKDGNYKVSTYRGEKKDKIYDNFILNEYKDIQVLKNEIITQVKKLDASKITKDQLATIKQYNEQLKKIRNKRPDLFKENEQKDNNENNVKEKAEAPEEKAKRIGNEVLDNMQHDYKNVHFTPEPLNENIINKAPITKDKVHSVKNLNQDNSNEQDVEEFYELKGNIFGRVFGGIINNISRFFHNIKFGIKGLIGKQKLISAAKGIDLKDYKEEGLEGIKVNNKDGNFEKKANDAIKRMQEAMIEKESQAKLANHMGKKYYKNEEIIIEDDQNTL